MKLKRFNIIKELIDKESKEQISKVTKRLYVGRHRTPDNLDALSFGQLLELQSMSTDRDRMYVPCRIILGMNDNEINEAECEEVIGFANFVTEELNRINGLFKSCSVPHTAEEQKAGIESLNFGTFGILDWYAQRMGIQDHDEVLRYGWVRIYASMQKDSAITMYERRLREIYNSKKK